MTNLNLPRKRGIFVLKGNNCTLDCSITYTGFIDLLSDNIKQNFLYSRD